MGFIDWLFGRDIGDAEAGTEERDNMGKKRKPLIRIPGISDVSDDLEESIRKRKKRTEEMQGM
jgi:hypothetical protein